MGERYTDYSEYDTERVRRHEASSAGLETQPLTPSNAPGLTTVPARPGVLAGALFAIGVVLLFGRMATLPIDVTGGMVILTMASVFYFFGFWKHLYGLIIPASILAGLSMGIPFANLTKGVSVVWGLAIGFMLVYVLGMGMFRQRSQWPIIPSVILFAVGVIIAVSNLPTFFAAGLAWMPLLLIAAGVYLGWLRQR